MDIKLNKLSLSFMLIFLAACSGGGGSDADSRPEKVGGIWTGHGVITGTSETYNIVGLIDENGKTHMATEYGMVYGNLTANSSNRLSGSFTALYYDTDLTPTWRVISGEVNDGQSMSMRIRGPLADNDVLLSYEDAYEQGGELSRVVGVWSDTVGGVTTTITVDSTGDFTGSDSDGCLFNGAISSKNTTYNSYDLEMTVSNCGGFNSTYTGQAAVIEESTYTELDFISHSSEGSFIIGFLYKQ